MNKYCRQKPVTNKKITERVTHHNIRDQKAKKYLKNKIIIRRQQELSITV